IAPRRRIHQRRGARRRLRLPQRASRAAAHRSRRRSHDGRRRPRPRDLDPAGPERTAAAPRAGPARRARACRPARPAVIPALCHLALATLLGAEPTPHPEPEPAADPEPTEPAPTDDPALAADPEIDSAPADDARTVVRQKRRDLFKAGGSVRLIEEEQLEATNYDDPHSVLTQVPGVYLRTEDGYGLRPNIGVRGVSPERSAKVTLMEDGVLFGPAPYAAPAAYYFPLVTRMTGV